MRSFFLNFFIACLFGACFFAVNSCRPQHSSDNSSLQQQRTPDQKSLPISTSQPTETSYDFSAIDRILERAAPQLGGCALVLIQDERVVYRKSFGGFETDRVVPIASASKWLSGALLMKLSEEGRISLDDSVFKYLPEFGAEKSNITIRHLFAHTSGLPPEAPCRNNKSTSLERCATEIARMKLRATPGEAFFYGGVSMHVGGRVAEVVSGKSWNELFVEKIAAPLGMNETDFFAYGSTQNPRPAGDARSSADEYGRFLQMILQRGAANGKQILSLASIVEMHKDQTGGARIVYTIYEKHAAFDPNLPLARYGLGVWREKMDDASQRVREVSSQGALGFTPWIDVERNLAGVLSVQSSFSRVMPVYLELKKEIGRIVPVSTNPLASEIN